MISTALASTADKKDPRATYSTEGWKLSWSEEFDKDGLVDEKTWKYEVGFVRNHEPQYYTRARKENCCVKDGVLTIRAAGSSASRRRSTRPPTS